ncbi:hypothetical protein ACIF6K_05740 [Streptomyces sp. NPDC085942]|uniref:hypothetical protein n=1 Tax=Streptomyces sp. NPDC085942 TaxID=3365743 RepID=UPI0037D74F80
MKRIHFTAEDLARTRVAPTIGVAAETFDSVRMLGNRDAGLAFRGWQVSVRGRLGEGAGPLAALMPARGPLVDAMSLMGAAPSIDEAVDTWMAAPRALAGATREPPPVPGPAPALFGRPRPRRSGRRPVTRAAPAPPADRPGVCRHPAACPAALRATTAV